MIVADFETTGTNVFDAEIITGHFVALNDSLNIMKTLSIQCNPFRWSDEAEAVHGISRRQASKFPKFNQVYTRIVDFIESSQAREFWCHSNSVMYGKLVPYDYALLRMQMLNMGDNPYWTVNGLRPYSTHSLAKVLQHRFTFEGFSLDNICKTLGIELKHHDAESDCLATVEIIKRLLPLTSRDELYNYERGINENASRSRRRNPKKSGQSSITINEF